MLCSINLQKKAFESKLLKFTTIIRKFKKFIIRGKESKILIWLWVKCTNPTMFLKEGPHMCHMLESLWIDGFNLDIKVQVLNGNHLRWTSLFLRDGTTEASQRGCYWYQNPPCVNRNMLKTKWRRHQRLRKSAILEQ